MSKTKRRMFSNQQVIHWGNIMSRDEYENKPPNKFWLWWYKKDEPYEVYLKRELAKYHADGGRTYMASAPSSYCRPYRRQERHSARRQIHKQLLQDLEDFDIPKAVNGPYGATWDYW